MAKSIVTGTIQENGIAFQTVSFKVGDDEAKGIAGVEGSYTLPATTEDFQKYMAQLSGDALTEAFKSYNYGRGLRARAALTESRGVVQPMVATKKWGKLDLVTGQAEKEGPVSLAAIVKYINGAVAFAAAKEEPLAKGVAAAVEQLVAAKRIRERNGVYQALGE